MIPLPRKNYIGRSIQKRKPLKELPCAPLHEKYVQIIDRYLLNSKKNSYVLTYRKSPTFTKTFASSENNFYSTFDSKNMFLPSKIMKNPKKTGFEHEMPLERKISISPCSLNIKVPDFTSRHRAKSEQTRRKGKIHCKVQTEFNAILENDSQEEESPLKFHPRYEF